MADCSYLGWPMSSDAGDTKIRQVVREQSRVRHCGPSRVDRSASADPTRLKPFGLELTLVCVLVALMSGCKDDDASRDDTRNLKTDRDSIPDLFFVPARAEDVSFHEKNPPSGLRPRGPAVRYSLRGISPGAYLEQLEFHLLARGWHPLSHDLQFQNRTAGSDGGWVLMDGGTEQAHHLWSQHWVHEDLGPLLIMVNRPTGDSEDDLRLRVGMTQFDRQEASLLLEAYREMYGLPWDGSESRPAAEEE